MSSFSNNVQYHLFTAHQIMYLRIAWIGVEGFTFELNCMTLRISCQQESTVVTGGSQT